MSIKASEINSLNNSIYNIGSSSKQLTSLPTNLQSSTGNNVAQKNVIDSISIENLKTAIKTLESKFSNNCCQSQCNATKTISSCQITVTATITTTVNCITNTATKHLTACSPYSAYSKHSDTSDCSGF